MEELSRDDLNEIFEMLRYDLDEALLALARSAELFQAEHGKADTAHAGRLQMRRDELFTDIAECLKAKERLTACRKSGEIDPALLEDLRRYRRTKEKLAK